jgi:hypothetical protein
MIPLRITRVELQTTCTTTTFVTLPPRSLYISFFHLLYKNILVLRTVLLVQRAKTLLHLSRIYLGVTFTASMLAFLRKATIQTGALFALKPVCFPSHIS